MRGNVRRLIFRRWNKRLVFGDLVLCGEVNVTGLLPRFNHAETNREGKQSMEAIYVKMAMAFSIYICLPFGFMGGVECYKGLSPCFNHAKTEKMVCGRRL